MSHAVIKVGHEEIYSRLPAALCTDVPQRRACSSLLVSCMSVFRALSAAVVVG